MAIAKFLELIKSEIDNDPEAVGYATMTDQEVADSLNGKDITKNILMPLSEVHDWASSKRLFKRFADAAKLDTDLYKEVQFLLQGKQETANFNATAASDLLDDLITEGLITAEEKSELVAKSEKQISRAEKIGFAKTVTAEWVARCREVE